MPKKISKQADAVINELDRFARGVEAQDAQSVTHPAVPILNTIETKPFKGQKLRSKIANNTFRPMLVALKRSFGGAITRMEVNHVEAMHKLDHIEAALTPEKPAQQLFDEKIYEMEKLVDRLKSEIMAEINKDQSPVGAAESIKTKIIDHKKYNSLKKINLGSGSFFKEGYVNVDHREIKGVDMVADIAHLPYEEATLKEIYLSHVAEHFTEKKLIELLTYWNTLLATGGRIVIVVPDIESMIHQFERREISWDNLRAVILGGQDYNSDYHFNVFSVEYMKHVIGKALPDSKIEIKASGRKNGECLELEVEIVK